MATVNKFGASAFLLCLATTALFAEEPVATLSKRIDVDLQRPDLGECTKFSKFAINQGLVSFNSCMHFCAGELQEAKLADLDFQRSVKNPKVPLPKGLSLVEVPCRSGGRCVSTTTSVSLGYNQGVGCQKFSDVRGGRDALLFVVQEPRADSLLQNLRQVR